MEDAKEWREAIKREWRPAMVRENKRPEGVFMDIRNMTIEDKKHIAAEVMADTGLVMGVWHAKANITDTGMELVIERMDGFKLRFSCDGNIDIVEPKGEGENERERNRC